MATALLYLMVTSSSSYLTPQPGKMLNHNFFPKGFFMCLYTPLLPIVLLGGVFSL